ncbi:PREDICTED: uncharacterized protein LOC102351696, partial [Pelobates cultripes]
QRIAQLQGKLNDIHLHTTATISYRLKLKTYTQGNKAGKAMAALLRQKRQNAKIPFILNAIGNKMYSPHDINNALADYYDTPEGNR